MPLAPEEIESASPDAWTGKPDALAYETEAEVAAWLSRRGLSAYDALDAADQESTLIQATDAAEGALRPRFRGVPVTTGQGLLFPAHGAYDSRGFLVGSAFAPPQYLQGIRHVAELMAADEWMLLAEGAQGIRSERSRVGGVTYRDNSDPSSISANHPDVWRMLASAVPQLT